MPAVDFIRYRSFTPRISGEASDMQTRRPLLGMTLGAVPPILADLRAEERRWFKLSPPVLHQPGGARPESGRIHALL